ncbi:MULTISPECIES: pyruvate kinase [Persicobacter]|uniref:Pyruvate kinase n=1 Tax=Persicobacter diffluens TaxID=981 RepID=A0AAN4VWZ6_9BACT|nr:pyruvate kinase [Persicobacter sp. CCB-QB2]GJM59855.1 pyruvate kinase [Persicobacter diffluens]
MKNTKIVATISDRKCDIPFLTEMYNQGMNVVRINTAHQTFDDSMRVVENVRAVSDKIGILVDTKGPEIRTTKIDEEFRVKPGDEVFMAGDPEGISTRELVYVNYAGFVEDVPAGSRILIDDGDVEFIVKENLGDKLLCIAQNSGPVKSRKSVNIPSVHVKLPSITAKDKGYIEWVADNNIDFVAHSFVRNAADVIAVQEILDAKGSDAKIIAKIENQEGVDNIDEILDHAHSIMVARGDLAVEIPQERIPITQKMIIDKCIARRKPVITATQMLHTMIENPRPTRAEISDVANAVYDGTDAVMLSGESAYGDYPIEAVKTMASIAEATEKYEGFKKDTEFVVLNNDISAFVAKSAYYASENLNPAAIITDSANGRTPRAIAAYRPKTAIFAKVYDERVMRELSLTYGVHASFLAKGDDSDAYIKESLAELKEKNMVEQDDRLVVVGGNFGDFHGASFLEVATVENIESNLKK